MANGWVGQFAVLAVSIGVFIVALIMFMKRKVQPETESPRRTPPAPAPAERPVNVLLKSTPVKPVATPLPDLDGVQPRTITAQAEKPSVQSTGAGSEPAASEAKLAPVIDLLGGLMSSEDRNERILAGISENIRKSLQTRPLPNHSVIPYSEVKPRTTEYVRVKREIITPHGHIRFSILKDWMSMNMLAVFRRAAMEWKTPEDLIAFVPPYLEVDAEILNNEVLLLGTSGHNERLAVPIRHIDESSPLYSCFEFVTETRTVSNTPAVLVPMDTDFEIVSRGIIAQTAFTNLIEQAHAEVKVLS
jgi:hypothetical protein